MSFTVSVHGHSEASADEVKAAVSKAFKDLEKVGASAGSLSGNDTEGQPFSVSYPEVAPGATMGSPKDQTE